MFAAMGLFGKVFNDTSAKIKCDCSIVRAVVSAVTCKRSSLRLSSKVVAAIHKKASKAVASPELHRERCALLNNWFAGTFVASCLDCDPGQQDCVARLRSSSIAEQVKELDDIETGSWRAVMRRPPIICFDDELLFFEIVMTLRDMSSLMSADFGLCYCPYRYLFMCEEVVGAATLKRKQVFTGLYKKLRKSILVLVDELINLKS